MDLIFQLDNLIKNIKELNQIIKGNYIMNIHMPDTEGSVYISNHNKKE